MPKKNQKAIDAAWKLDDYFTRGRELTEEEFGECLMELFYYAIECEECETE